MPYQYSFNAPFEGYVHNFLKSNYWKVERTHDYEDVMQEARMKFYLLLKRMERNGSTVENQKHLMALFKTTWGNHFITLAQKSSAYKETSFTSSAYSTDDSEEFDLEKFSECEDCQAYMEVKLSQATGEVREVLNLIFNTPKEVLELVARANGSRDIFNNKVLCRVLGKDSTKVNLIQLTKKYLND